MAIVFEHIESGNPVLPGVRLSGTVADGDQAEFTAQAERLAVGEASGLIVDMDLLGSMSEDLAGEMAVWQRRLMDHDGEMVFVRPNVVINWYLDKRFGPLPHRTFETVDEAVSALVSPAATEELEETTVEPDGDEISELVAPEWSVNVNEAGRPDRISFEVVHKVMRESQDPQLWLESLRVMLRRTGLGGSIQLCCRNGDKLELVDRTDYRFTAKGWLGSLLTSADCPLGLSEIAGEGLTLQERAFLKWCDADVVVPLLDDDAELRGVLFVNSGRDGGLYTYRSSELLSLSLLGRLLARYLPAPEATEAQDDLETLVDKVAPELLTL